VTAASQGAKPGFFHQLVPVVVNMLKGAFPELENRVSFVMDVLKDEEMAFNRTLDKVSVYCSYYNISIALCQHSIAALYSATIPKLDYSESPHDSTAVLYWYAAL
jgi:tRNA synthetases class II (A)